MERSCAYVHEMYFIIFLGSLFAVKLANLKLAILQPMDVYFYKKQKHPDRCRVLLYNKVRMTSSIGISCCISENGSYKPVTCCAYVLRWSS